MLDLNSALRHAVNEAIDDAVAALTKRVERLESAEGPLPSRVHYTFNEDADVFVCKYCGIQLISLKLFENPALHHRGCELARSLWPPDPKDPLMASALKALVSMAEYAPPTYQEPDEPEMWRCCSCRYAYLRREEAQSSASHYSYCRWRRIKEVVSALAKEGRLP